MTEEWRAVPGFPRYEVSNDGRVRLATAWKQYPRGYALVLQTNQRGYHFVSLTGPNGRRAAMTVARIMALAFLGPPPTPGYHAVHRNGDNRDDRLANIRWASPSENERDKLRHGTSVLLRGGRRFRTVLTKEHVRHMRALRAQGIKLKDIAREVGVSVGRAWAVTTSGWEPVA